MNTPKVTPIYANLTPNSPPKFCECLPAPNRAYHRLSPLLPQRAFVLLRKFHKNLYKPIEKSVGFIFLPFFCIRTAQKFFEIFLKRGFVFLTFVLRWCSEEQKPGIRFPQRTLTTEYTFIRYIPERRGNPQPYESAP